MSDENTTPTPEQVLQETPTPDAINQQMEDQARVVITAATLGVLTQQIHSFVGMLTNGNPRLALAISNELSLIYSEAIRRSMKEVDPTPPASEIKQVAND